MVDSYTPLKTNMSTKKGLCPLIFSKRGIWSSGKTAYCWVWRCWWIFGLVIFETFCRGTRKSPLDHHFREIFVYLFQAFYANPRKSVTEIHNFVTSFEVLVDDDPPCPFVSYVELTNSGGRILRGGGQAACFQNG